MKPTMLSTTTFIVRVRAYSRYVNETFVLLRDSSRQTENMINCNTNTHIQLALETQTDYACFLCMLFQTFVYIILYFVIGPCPFKIILNKIKINKTLNISW